MRIPNTPKWDENYWTDRYDQGMTQWDIGHISTPLKAYIDQLDDPGLKILIPGGGNAYEAEYLFNRGFSNVFVVDLSDRPLHNLKERVPNFPEDQLIKGDFFDLDDTNDLIIEQTFFCALHPDLRTDYALKVLELLQPGGRLVGVLFEDTLFSDHPPYGGFRDEYITYFEGRFEVCVFERCYNSIPPRTDRELFINMRKPAI
jgi:thiopurine S-methyltransferase